MKKLLIYIAAFAMILAMNTSCEDMGSLEEHPKKVDATTFMANAKEVESVINSIYFQLRRDPGFSRYLIVLEEGLADYCIGRGNYATAYDTGLLRLLSVHFLHPLRCSGGRCIRSHHCTQ